MAVQKLGCCHALPDSSLRGCSSEASVEVGKLVVEADHGWGGKDSGRIKGGRAGY